MPGRKKTPKPRKKHVAHKSQRVPVRRRAGWVERLDGRTTHGREVNNRLRALTLEYVGEHALNSQGRVQPQCVPPQMMILFRSLIGAEGIRIRLDAELKEHESKGRKMSSFPAIGMYHATLDKINAVTRQLAATKAEGGTGSDVGIGSVFAEAMQLATYGPQGHVMPREEPRKGEALTKEEQLVVATPAPIVEPAAPQEAEVVTIVTPAADTPVDDEEPSPRRRGHLKLITTKE